MNATIAGSSAIPPLFYHGLASALAEDLTQVYRHGRLGPAPGGHCELYVLVMRPIHRPVPNTASAAVCERVAAVLRTSVRTATVRGFCTGYLPSAAGTLLGMAVRDVAGLLCDLRRQGLVATDAMVVVAVVVFDRPDVDPDRRTPLLLSLQLWDPASQVSRNLGPDGGCFGGGTYTLHTKGGGMPLQTLYALCAAMGSVWTLFLLGGAVSGEGLVAGAVGRIDLGGDDPGLCVIRLRPAPVGDATLTLESADGCLRHDPSVHPRSPPVVSWPGDRATPAFICAWCAAANPWSSAHGCRACGASILAGLLECRCPPPACLFRLL